MLWRAACGLGVALRSASHPRPSLLIAWGLFSTSAFAAEPLRLAVSASPLCLPIFVADKQNYFADEGLNLQLQELVGGHRAMQTLLDGQADLATASETVLVFNSFKSRQFAVLGSFVSSNKDSKIIVRAGAGIAQWQDMPGKRVGTVLGAASHYFLDTSLLAAGLDPRAMKVQHAQPEHMAELLKHGDLDAVSIWEPFPFKILQTVPGSRVLPGSISYRLSFNLVAGRALIGARDDELARLLRALDRAERFIAEKPALAQALLRERLKLDKEFIDWIWPSYQYRLTLDQALLASLEAQARWAQREGHVAGERPPNYLALIYSKPLRQVAPAAVSLIE
ncbi:ABC transporter substrate-binding protein [Paucibacter sp. AS339]|uniref:ABC transporter substrate-binding protein n=1 Tax=Paucibacter hankyongi TaxID=3133434 RepID=UPI0030B7BE6F